MFSARIFALVLTIVSSQNEITLQQNLAQGKEGAFEAVFRSYFKLLTVFAKKYVQDLSVAEDIVQDVFVKIYEKRETLQFHTSLKAFLYQAVHNKCIDHLRSNKVKSDHHNEIGKSQSEADFHDMILQAELEERIYKAISDLPEQCELIFKMSRLEGKRNQEIAELLQISKRTVETQISKALKRLRQDIFPYLKSLIMLSIWPF